MTLSEISTVTHGSLLGEDVSFASVSTDTRTLNKGDLFIALTGENFDGNTYVAQAEAGGAVAAVISRDTGATLPRLLVDDSALALGQIGARNRQLSSAKVLGITGSQGKTTVKEMLAAILGRCGKVAVTRANLNNTLGVPITLLGIQADDEFAVIEMGANMAGEIACSVSFAAPVIAHITNVAPTHLEGFGSLEGVAIAKSEIWSGLTEDGTAVINLDDAFAEQWLAENSSRRCIGISAKNKPQADYAIDHFTLNPRGKTEAVLRSPQGVFTLQLNLPGKHNLANALAAAAMAMEAGAVIPHVQDGLAAMLPVSGRMARLSGANGALVIDDSYNASPASFHAAIDVLATYSGETILVMGDMGELGVIRESAHEEVGEYARKAGISRLLATGEMSRLAVSTFGEKGRHFDSQNELLQVLLPQLTEKTSVLVKGSRSARMDKLIAPLTRGGC
jgi:UDP-N-acetylmuramoyl-tripeptide--D-alanyl-D-alanine ligase